MTTQQKMLNDYETSDYLAAASKKLIHKYLKVAWEEMLAEKDPMVFVTALGNACKAKGMTEVSKQAGLARESLYRSIVPGSKVRFETVLKLMLVFGFNPVKSKATPRRTET